MRRTTRRNERRGVVVALFAILLPVLLIILGFSVDLAHMQKTRAELRLAADSAARAGAAALARTDNLAQARKAVRDIASENEVAGKGLRIENSDIEFGRSERGKDDRFVFTLGGTPTNAVRINAARSGASKDGAVPLYFGNLIGKKTFEPQFSAIGSFVNTDICLVLDRSTSMKKPATSTDTGMYTNDPRFCASPYSDSRWAALDAAVRVFTQTMRDTKAEEQVAVATYASNIAKEAAYKQCKKYMTMQEATLDSKLTEKMDSIDNVMDDLMSSIWNGNTYIEAGMRTGMSELIKRGRSTADKRMIVMTDGFQNVGNAKAAAADCAANNIQVHAITFGVHADKNLMREVATIGGGRYQHANNPTELIAAFRELAAAVARITE